MKYILAIIFLMLTTNLYNISAQEKDKDYIEFNDRKNIVHGFYLGLNVSFGKIEKENASAISLKLAYVANRKFEIGLTTKGIYSQQNLSGIFPNTEADLAAFYSGLHLEPIFFSKSKINLSFPILIGGGAAGYINEEWSGDELEDRVEKDWDAIFVIEPGINALYNISRYVQFEAGIRYRFSSKLELNPNTIDDINGFSISIGTKVGIFNLGRNRYKKKIPKENE